MNTPALAIYHPNARGTGCAIKLTLVKPTPIEGSDEFTDGYLELTIASQDTAGKQKLPTFDWDNSIDARLFFGDISKILAVLHGLYESVEDGKGLFIHKPNGERVNLRFRHMVEPFNGYSIEASRNSGDNNWTTAHIYLSDTEAIGVCYAIESAIGKVVFGD